MLIGKFKSHACSFKVLPPLHIIDLYTKAFVIKVRPLFLIWQRGRRLQAMTAAKGQGS